MSNLFGHNTPLEPESVTQLRDQLGLSVCQIRPYAHQVVGVKKLYDEPAVGLFDEMGAGKTKQVIDGAQVLHREGIINCVVVIAPAPVRAVWYDPELGELAKHLWATTTSRIVEFHSRKRSWDYGKVSASSLIWVITNYDFIREATHLAELKEFCDKETLLVLDESSAVKNSQTKQAKACRALRECCGRVVLLNGTPIAHSPLDMYSQGQIMDPKILECSTVYHFRSRYAVLGGWQRKQIVGWVNLEDLQRRFAPYVLRRLKSMCIDLPEKIPSVPILVTLSDSSWKIYQEIRDEMVAWLSSATVSTATQAIVKALRLAQVTSGFIGGLEQSINDDPDQPILFRPAPPQEVGVEKLQTFLEWLDARLDEDPNFKLLVWCRFRPELQRLYDALTTKYSSVLTTRIIWGGQKPEERDAALRVLDPRTMPPGPVVVLGTPSSGSMGLNLTGAHTVVYMSNDYSLKTRLQSEDRVHRPGQHHPVSYYDVVAVGPKGQRTIDHVILKALRDKNDIATWTTAAWISELTQGQD